MSRSSRCAIGPGSLRPSSSDPRHSRLPSPSRRKSCCRCVARGFCDTCSLFRRRLRPRSAALRVSGAEYRRHLTPSAMGARHARGGGRSSEPRAFADRHRLMRCPKGLRSRRAHLVSVRPECAPGLPGTSAGPSAPLSGGMRPPSASYIAAQKRHIYLGGRDCNTSVLPRSQRHEEAASKLRNSNELQYSDGDSAAN